MISYLLSFLQALNLYNDGLLDAHSKNYISAKNNFKNVMKKLNEMDKIEKNEKNDVISIKSLLHLNHIISNPFEIGDIVEIVGKKINKKNDKLYDAVIISKSKIKNHYDCALRVSNIMNEIFFSIFNCNVVVNYDINHYSTDRNMNNWRHGKTSKIWSIEGKKIEIKFDDEENIELWDVNDIYIYCSSVVIHDIYVNTLNNESDFDYTIYNKRSRKNDLLFQGNYNAAAIAGAAADVPEERVIDFPLNTR